jgi:hypothetical protein
MEFVEFGAFQPCVATLCDTRLLFRVCCAVWLTLTL